MNMPGHNIEDMRRALASLAGVTPAEARRMVVALRRALARSVPGDGCARPCYMNGARSVSPLTGPALQPEQEVSMLTPDNAVRFWSKVNKDGPTMAHMESACWLWMGRKRSGSGYGEYETSDRKKHRAHRVAWVLANGDVGSMLCCHRCDIPACVNPSHMFLGTVADNNADCRAKGRAGHGVQPKKVRTPKVWRKGGTCGERRPGAKLTDATVVELRRLAGTMTQRALASLFGVSAPTINKVLRGGTWTHVPTGTEGVSI